METELDILKQNIGVIIGTATGKRVMQRDFGSTVRSLMDAPINRGTLTALYAATAEAIRKWEPAVTVQQVKIDRIAPGNLRLNIIISVDGVISNYEYSLT